MFDRAIVAIINIELRECEREIRCMHRNVTKTAHVLQFILDLIDTVKSIGVWSSSSGLKDLTDLEESESTEYSVSCHAYACNYCTMVWFLSLNHVSSLSLSWDRDTKLIQIF